MAESEGKGGIPAFSIKEAWKAESGELRVSADVYAEQLNSCPVTRTPMPGAADVYHVFRAADVLKVCLNPEAFPSGSENPRFGRRVIPIELDPPAHGKYRRLLNGLMNTRRLLGYEQAARDYIEPAIDKLVAQGGGDVVELTSDLPLRAFCLLLGEEDMSIVEMNRERRRLQPTLDDTSPEATAFRASLLNPIREMVRRRLEACLEHPGDNLASDIAHGEVDGRQMPLDEAENMLTLLYMAGTGTTTGGMQGSLMRLAMDQEAQQRLRQEPRGIPAAIEECLRIESPVAMMPRHCAVDTEIAGQVIPAGSEVFPVFGAANVDPEAFPDPARFDIDRKPTHFAFGRGIHTCVGAPLGRMQIRVLIETILNKSSGFELVGTPKRNVWPHTGFAELSLSIQPV